MQTISRGVLYAPSFFLCRKNQFFSLKISTQTNTLWTQEQQFCPTVRALDNCQDPYAYNNMLGNFLIVLKVMHFALNFFKGIGNTLVHSYDTTTDCWAPYLQQHTKGTSVWTYFLCSRIVRCDQVLVRLSVRHWPSRHHCLQYLFCVPRERAVFG